MSTIRHSWPRAAKRYGCIECGRSIMPGDRHLYAVGWLIEAGGFYAMREHIACYERRTRQKAPVAA